MSEPQVRARERERDLDRFLTFVDAIVAIAVTLLVLPLAELATDVDAYASVGRMLGDNASLLWSFALSFYVIMRLWLSQHRAVSPLLVDDRRIISLLILWTFTIVTLPFWTSLVASSAGHEAATKALYVGTMAVSVGLVGLLRGEVARHPELTDGTPYAGALGGVISATLLVLALAVMLALPATSYFPMVLLALDGLVTRLLRKSERPRPA